VFAIASLVSATGCPGGKKKNEVTGKVTLDGKPVAGNVIFVGSDNKEIATLIKSDGTYVITDPPTGQVKVKVTGPLGVAAPPPLTKDKTPETVGGMGGGNPPPAKYASVDNGLTFNVTGGKQVYDITLTP